MTTDEIDPLSRAAIAAMTVAGRSAAATTAELNSIKLELDSVKLERNSCVQELEASCKEVAAFSAQVDAARSHQKTAENQRDSLTTEYETAKAALELKLGEAEAKVRKIQFAYDQKVTIYSQALQRTNFEEQFAVLLARLADSDEIDRDDVKVSQIFPPKRTIF